MDMYEKEAYRQLIKWQRRMAQKPSPSRMLTKEIQNRINGLYPEKFHTAMTFGVKKMVQAVMSGSEFLSNEPPLTGVTLAERERFVREKISFYKKAATAEGAGTGAGGIFLGLADFPLLLSLKFKFLFDSARIYGFDVKEPRERLYILMIFQLAFSSEKRRFAVYGLMKDWEKRVAHMSLSMEAVDWRLFQQEYRDYIDLAKLLQLMPGIGSFAGALANYRLMNKLGETAMNSYRMRILSY